MCSMPTHRRTVSSLTPALPVLGRELAVRGRGRVRGERLGIADVDEPREQLQRIEEALAAGAPALHAEGQQAEARPAHQLLHEGVVGVVFRPA